MQKQDAARSGDARAAQMLGIDLGTSYIKGGVLNLQSGEITHVTRRPFPDAAPGLPPLHHEVEPDAVVDATRALLRELAEHAPEAAGLLVSSQMHGFVLTDRTGQATTRLITWLDQRALAPLGPGPEATALAEIEKLLSSDDILAMGNGFKPSLPLCALYTLRRQNRLPAEETYVWSLSDYVLAQLADMRQPDAWGVEPTIAVSFGGFDFSTGDWQRDVLSRLGLDTLVWPRIAATTEPVTTLNIGKVRTIPVYPALGDHQCATLGSLLQPGELSLNISTGSQVSLLREKWVANTDYESRPYFGGRYLNTVTRVPAGRALAALMQLLTEIPRRQGIELTDAWQTVAQAVAETEDEGGPAVNLSFFASPFGDAGAISQLAEANMTLGHLFRAAFANMAQNYAQCALWLKWREHAAGDAQLVFAGGLPQRFPELRDAIALKLQASYRMSPHPEDTLLGLLALGLVITQRATDLDAAVAWLRKVYAA